MVYSPAEERFDRITQLARSVFRVPIAYISLVSSDMQWFKSVQGLTLAETPREISFCGHAILGDELLEIPDAQRDPRFADNPMVIGEPFIRFYAGYPINHQGSKVGTLCIVDYVPRRLSAEERDDLRNLAGLVESELRISAFSESQSRLLKELHEARRQALIDPLTKVWNRRGLDKVLQREAQRARRDHTPVAIMLVDVDNFKEINDKYGHLAGDAALQEVALRLRNSVRPHDLIARYGGDEFLVYLANTGEKTVRHLAKRILQRISGEPVEAAGVTFPLNTSVGVSVATVLANLSMEKVIEEADSALYVAKEDGRGCIRYAGGPPARSALN
jgi:diguanylate cyclase (GGDEF)-like protein